MFLIEVTVTMHKINHFQVYSSVAFMTFIMLRDHRLYQFLKHFPRPKGKPVPIKQLLPISSSALLIDHKLYPF